MSTKFVRFVAALAVMVSIVGNTGGALAANGGALSDNSQNLEPPHADLNLSTSSALTIPPASSLGVQFVHVATAANITFEYGQSLIIP